MITAEAKGTSLPDVNRDSVPDALEVARITNDQTKAARDYTLKMAELQAKSNANIQKLQVERERNQVNLKNQSNDLEIAKINSRNRKSKS